MGSDLVQQTTRDAKLGERVLKLVAVAKEAAVEDQCIDRRLDEARGWETSSGMEGLAV